MWQKVNILSEIDNTDYIITCPLCRSISSYGLQLRWLLVISKVDRVTFANIIFTIVNIIFTFANIIFTTLLLLVASRLGAMVSASKRHFHKGDIPQTALNYTAPLFFTEQAIFWKEKLSK